MSELAISARGVRKSFEEGRIVALAGMDLDVKAGEFVAIVGPPAAASRRCCTCSPHSISRTKARSGSPDTTSPNAVR